MTWPTLVHRELHQQVKLAKNEVYQPSQVATMKNLPVPQAEKKARVKKTKEMKAGGPAKQLKRKHSGHLSSFEVSKIIINKGIWNRTELLALMNVLKAEGQTNLA